MTALIKHPSVHSGKLERYLGKDTVEHLSACMRPWYGRPIGLGYVPGKVLAAPGGDFVGRIHGGLEVGAREIAHDFWERGRRGLKAVDPAQVNAAFASLSDFIAAFSNPPQRRSYPLNKIGASGTTNATGSLWQSAGWPPAGAAGSAAPGGRACDVTTTGAWPFNNAAGGQTQKFVAAYVNGSVINCTLLLYDRIFDVAKTMASSTTEAVTGVPTRYQNTLSTADDYAGDNFLFIECQSVLAATAHNWTICQYTNQAGTTLQTLPSVTGVSSCAAQRLDQPLGTWFCPLSTGDKGIAALTQMQCSASVATGAINFCIGHPIAWIPGVAIAAAWSFTDGATTAFARIFDSACLALLEPVRPTSTACTYAGALYGVCS